MFSDSQYPGWKKKHWKTNNNNNLKKVRLCWFGENI